MQRGNPDAIGYVWAGEFDLNTLHVDGNIFESVKLRIQKYLDTCGRGLKLHIVRLRDWTRFLRHLIKKISGFTRPHVIGFVVDIFFPL